MHWGFLFSGHPHFEAVARFLPHSLERRLVQAGPLSGWVRTTLCCRKVVSEVLRIPILCAIVSKQFACLIRLMRSYLVGNIGMYKMDSTESIGFFGIESNHSSWLFLWYFLHLLDSTWWRMCTPSQLFQLQQGDEKMRPICIILHGSLKLELCEWLGLRAWVGIQCQSIKWLNITVHERLAQQYD